jgi:glycine/betaine/sarcosine/D-proline reductase family selenoprotein B
MDSFRFTPSYVEIVMKNYPYLHYDTSPFTPLNKELKNCKVSLVTTGGFYVEGEQKPYDLEREKIDPGWGDPTYRVIPRNVHREKLKIAHRHYNKGGVRKDVNVVFPLDRFEELEKKGEIGLLSQSHYSFQGNIPNVQDLILRFGVEVALRLKMEKVDFVFMTPA